VLDVANTTDALIKAYRALSVFLEDHEGLASYIAAADPKALEQAREAREWLVDAMGIAYYISLLPSYTEVDFAVNGSQVCRGMIRDNAFQGEGERRITNLTTGMEFFVTPETEFDHFVITKAMS